jgi:hypothetical protein
MTPNVLPTIAPRQDPRLGALNGLRLALLVQPVPQP